MGLGIKSKILTHLLIKKKMPHWEELYGPFDQTNYDSYTLKNISGESGVFYGELVKWAQDLAPLSGNCLLVGDSKESGESVKHKAGLQSVLTAGLGNADYCWNFEQDPPKDIGKFGLIISQAILEHLIDPYKHMRDLSNLLLPGGHLIIYTVLPGFTYHRHPIDTMRFYPDWFEEIAKRLSLSVIKKRIKDKNIFYMYRLMD